MKDLLYIVNLSKKKKKIIIAESLTQQLDDNDVQWVGWVMGMVMMVIVRMMMMMMVGRVVRPGFNKSG